MSPYPLPYSPNPLSSTSSPLLTRDVGQQFSDAKSTLSSWNSCMAKSYCKWPVIVAIIVGVLIILSLLLCCFRCLCCGVECCFGCFKGCNVCCPSPRRPRRKSYQQTPQQPPSWNHQPTQDPPYGFQQPYTQPQPQNSMMYGALNNLQFPKQQPPPPQFARFDTVSSRGTKDQKPGEETRRNEDRLPEMPSYATAQSRQIEDTSYRGPEHGKDDEAIPLTEQSRPSLPRAASSGSAVPLASPTSPNNPFQTPTHAMMAGGNLGSHRQHQSPYGPPTSRAPAPAPLATGYASPADYQKPSSPVSPLENHYQSSATSPAEASAYGSLPPSFHARAQTPSRMPTSQDTSGAYGSDYSGRRALAAPVPPLQDAAGAYPSKYGSRSQTPVMPARQASTSTYTSNYSAYPGYGPAGGVSSPPPPMPSARTQYSTQGYSAYSTAQTQYQPYSAYKPGTGAAASPSSPTLPAAASELDAGTAHWGEGSQRKPLQGSWREV